MSAAVHFVTGFPGFIGKRLLPSLLEKSPDERVIALVHPSTQAAAEEELAKLAPKARERVSLLLGDVVDMHLGLSSSEYRMLSEEVSDIYHLAGLYRLRADARSMEAVNVEGTRNMLELATDIKNLRRFNHMSTSVVSGDRVGVIEEDELDVGQRFRSEYERTKFRAEMLVRHASGQIPTSIFRPGIVVGDSKTGAIDRFDGPYYLAILLVTSPVAVPLPLPGSAVAPLNVVPVDFVVEAMQQISDDPRGEGKTFHLVDPNPMAVRRVYELIAENTGKRLPPLRMSYTIADKLLRIPLLERLVRDERAAITSVNHLAIYSSPNTQELLDGTGIRCPRLTQYLDKLIAYVKEEYVQRRSENESEPHDPLHA